MIFLKSFNNVRFDEAMWMDQRTPFTVQGRNQTKPEHLGEELSHLSHVVWFENTADNLMDTKQNTLNTLGKIKFEYPSQFVWFDDPPTIV